jgi:hypothetical protein
MLYSYASAPFLASSRDKRGNNLLEFFELLRCYLEHTDPINVLSHELLLACWLNFLISVRNSVQAAQVSVFLAHPILQRTRMSTDLETTEREAALQ